MKEKEDNELNYMINNNEEEKQKDIQIEDKDEKENELVPSKVDPFENININQRCYRCTGDIMLGFTYLGRIILTLYTFHGLFFIYNCIFQYIILFAGVLYDIDNLFLQILFALIYILFSLSAGNILVIPTYEFLTFPFMSYRNPFIHLMSFSYIIKNVKFDTEKALKKNSNFVNAFLIVLEFVYLIGFICVWASLTTKIKDYCKFFILILLYCYYLLIIFCYAIMLIYIMINLLLTSYREYIKTHEKIKESFLRKYWNILTNSVLDLNNYFDKREELPDVNLLSYIINPNLMKYYKFKDGNQVNKKHMEDYCDTINIYQKLLLLFMSILVLIILIFHNSSGANFFAVISFIFLFLVMSTLSIGINFPFGFRNKKTFGSFFASTNYKYTLKVRHPIMIPLIRFICNLLVILVCGGLVGIFFFDKDKESTPNDFEALNLNGTKINDLTEHTRGKLLPNMCFSSLYYFPIPSFLPFINDAYYYSKGSSSLNIQDYFNLFYSDKYKVTVFDDLIQTSQEKPDKELGNVKMIQYNVVGEKTSLTILSIKGTSYKKDIFLDIQLYFPSVLLNILSTFSLSQKDNLSNKLIEYSLSIPYRVFFQFLIIDKYIELLQTAYEKNRHNFLKDIIIVGHSLGGGLAKILGRFLRKQAISLSGPGMNAFNSLWEYKGDSEYFGISAIDLVPDMDLVPRVEVSGGTIYRIICIKGVFGCHGKERSLCEVMIMCRHPNYKIYCSKIAKISDEEIDKLYKNSELNLD